MHSCTLVKWPICQIPSCAPKSETLSASLISKIHGACLKYSAIFQECHDWLLSGLNVCSYHGPAPLWWEKTAFISHSWSIWDSNRLTSCDTKTFNIQRRSQDVRLWEPWRTGVSYKQKGDMSSREWVGGDKMAAGFHKVHFNMNRFQLLTVQFRLELVTSKASNLRGPNSSSPV